MPTSRNPAGGVGGASGSRVDAAKLNSPEVNQAPIARQAHRRQPEAVIQRTIVQHYRQRAIPGVFMFAVPNGGLRSKTEAAIMRGTGTVAGVPDLVWVKDAAIYALEIKSATGRLTPAQCDCHERLRAAGAIVGVARGIDEALAWLEGHHLLRGRVS
jgi:hypothetical protein